VHHCKLILVGIQQQLLQQRIRGFFLERCVDLGNRIANQP